MSKALLLAAGLGTRLRPLTDTVPKCMVEIGNRPLIDIWLEKLCKAEISEVIVNTHYLHSTVERYLSTCVNKYRHMKIRVEYEGELLGTAGTLFAHEEKLRDGHFLVIHADNFVQEDISELLRAHNARKSDCIVTMATFETESKQDCGIALTDEYGVVQKYWEKDPHAEGKQANGALYVFEPELFTLFRDSKPRDISTDILPMLTGRIQTHVTAGYYIDVGTLARLEYARDVYGKNMEGSL